MKLTIVAVITLSAFSAAAAAQTPPTFEPVPDNAVLSTNIEGLPVHNRSNETVGTIKDQVIASGRLTGYILSVGGFLGMGEHYVVVSPAGLRLAYDARAKSWSAEMDATRDELRHAPAFAYEGRWRK